MIDFFKNIFKSKPKVSIGDFSAIAVDMHSHLIPAIDDGSKSNDESLIMIRKLEELGYKKIITTPHIMSGGYDNTTEIIQNGTKQLNEFLAKESVGVKLECSSEYYLDGHFDNLIAKNDLMPFGNNYILFELSYMFKPNNLETAIFNLELEGYKPILAHPERYKYMADKSLDQYRKIRDSGVKLQLNLFSLVGAYGDLSRQIGEQLIAEKMVDFVGTDLHNPLQLNYFDALLENAHLDALIQQDRILNKSLL